ncbi:MAG: hypothetical protein NTW16_03045 [Bacteroidetes bacterium]|nr:hypothetical protein [Bacteroidota bacterium]
MKTASGILLTFIMLVFFTGMTFSQTASTTNPAKAPAKSVTAAPGKFVDTSKSGVCDGHGPKGDCGQGKNYVDKNGDGKCDNCGTAGKCKESAKCSGKGAGCGSTCGKGQGKGNCCGQGQQHRNGCSNQGAAPASNPKK